MARRLIALMVVLGAGLLLPLAGLAGEMQAAEGTLVDGRPATALDLQEEDPYPGPQETPSPYPPTSQAIPLISLVLLAALLVILVVGVGLRFCLRRGR